MSLNNILINNTYNIENINEHLFVPSKNIIDRSTNVDGYISRANGRIESSGAGSNYETTDYIFVGNGQSIAFSHYRAFLAFNASKTPILESFILESMYYQVYTATADGYIRASLYKSELDEDTAQIQYTSVVPFERNYYTGYYLEKTHIDAYDDLNREFNNLLNFVSDNEEILYVSKLQNGFFKDYIIFNSYYGTNGEIQNDSSGIYRRLPLLELPLKCDHIRIHMNNKLFGLRCYDSSKTFIDSGSYYFDNDVQVAVFKEGTVYAGFYWRKDDIDDYSDAYLVFDNYGDIIFKKMRQLSIEKETSPNIISIQNSDKIAIIGDSYTESHYTIKNKAYINKLSLFSDYEFVNWGVSGDIYLGRLNSIRTGSNHYGSLTFENIAPKYAMMCCYTNDTKYMNVNDYIKCLDNICTVLNGLGTTPIICTEYHTGRTSENCTSVKSALKYYAESHNYLFWDIATYNSIVKQNNYPPFWGGSHAGTRTNAIESDPYEMYLNGLERPQKSLKLFRLRGNVSYSSLDEILFKTNEDRAKLFKEINVGHTYITDSTLVDNCENASNTRQYDEYQQIQTGTSIPFGNVCLISCVMPTVSKNISKVKLNLYSLGVSNVFVLDRLAEPYNTYTRYARFDYTALTNAPQPGDTYTSNDTTYTVSKVVPNIGDTGSLGSIFCTPYTINNNSGGTLTRTSGSGDSSIPYNYKAIGYDIQNVETDTCGHWIEVEGIDNIYEVTDTKSCIEMDKIHFLLIGSSIGINNVYVEYVGNGDKLYDLKQVELKYNLNNMNEELLPSNKFASPGNLDPNWNVTTSDIYEHTQGYDTYPDGCNSIVKVTNTISLDCTIDKSNLKSFRNTAYLEIWCRYFQPIYSSGTGNQITEDSYDYNDIIAEIGTGNRIIKLSQRVNTYWKIVRMPVIINDNLSDLYLSIKSDSKGIEVAYVSLKYED